MKEIFKAISDELIDTQSNILPYVNIDENSYSKKASIRKVKKSPNSRRFFMSLFNIFCYGEYI